MTHDLLPEVYGDPTQISYVFASLIDNSIKFRSEQPPRISRSAQPPTVRPGSFPSAITGSASIPSMQTESLACSSESTTTSIREPAWACRLPGASSKGTVAQSRSSHTSGRVPHSPLPCRCLEIDLAGAVQVLQHGKTGSAFNALAVCAVEKLYPRVEWRAFVRRARHSRAPCIPCLRNKIYQRMPNVVVPRSTSWTGPI